MRPYIWCMVEGVLCPNVVRHAPARANIDALRLVSSMVGGVSFFDSRVPEPLKQPNVMSRMLFLTRSGMERIPQCRWLVSAFGAWAEDVPIHRYGQSGHSWSYLLEAEPPPMPEGPPIYLIAPEGTHFKFPQTTVIAVRHSKG